MKRTPITTALSKSQKLPEMTANAQEVLLFQGLRNGHEGLEQGPDSREKAEIFNRAAQNASHGLGDRPDATKTPSILAAIKALDRLPLSDQEKADLIRRLLAEQSSD